MAKKKKRSGVKVSKNERDARLHSGTETKKFVPMARNLLFLDLIFLAIIQWMANSGTMSEAVAGWMTLLGLILLLIALYIQFGKSDKRGGTITR